MRFLLSLFISFSIVTAPFAAEVGEKRPFTVKDHLLTQLTKEEAKDFEKTLREELAKARHHGVDIFGRRNRPRYVETKKGHWESKSEGHKVSFSSTDIYEGRILINGAPLMFRDVPLETLQTEAEKLLKKKSSYLRFMIDDAYACELVCGAVILVLAAAVVGSALYQLMIKPEKMVKRLQDMKKRLDSDANSCEESKSDPLKYDQTFALASSLSDRTALNSVSSPSTALEFAIKNQLSNGDRKNEDCFQIMNEVGKKVKLDIPIPTQRQIQMRELSGGTLTNDKVDVANAAFNLCSSYNKLGSCMEGFVAAHVNDSGVSTFKDSAEFNHYKYQRKAGASRQ